MNVILKRTLRLVAIFVVFVAVGLGLLVSTYSLPKDAIVKNLSKDIDAMVVEGPYPQLVSDSAKVKQDNYTDAIMQSLAIRDDSKSALDATLKASWWEAAGPPNPVDSLAARLSTNPETALNAYAIYWQGYLVFLRPLLTVFSYFQIRIINTVVLLGLSCAVLFFLFKRLGLGACAAFVVAILCIGPRAIPLNMQFTNIFVICLAAVLILLLLCRNRPIKSWDIEYFFLVGAIAVFVDFLTVPLVSLCVPLLVLLVIRLKKESKNNQGGSLKESLLGSVKTVARATSSWVAGYVGVWAAKWILCSTLTDYNIMNAAIKKIFERTGSTMMFSDRIAVLQSNLWSLWPATSGGQPSFTPLIITALVIVVAWIIGVLLTKTSRSQIVSAVPIILIGLTPYLWYMVVSDHSMHHYWFTYRNQVITVFSLGLFMVFSLDWPEWVKAPMGATSVAESSATPMHKSRHPKPKRKKK